MDRNGIGQLQIIQKHLRTIHIAAVKLDHDIGAADLADRADVTVENTLADLLAGAVIQLDVVIIPHLHHAVIEAEYLSGVHDLRRLRRCGVDLLADSFIQAIDRCLALGAERR